MPAPEDNSSNAAVIRVFNKTENHCMEACSIQQLDYHSFYQPIPHQPLWLTDRHLSPELALRNIVCIPSILYDMLQSFEKTWTRFLTENHVFPQPYLPHDLVKSLLRGIESPSDVFCAYKIQISEYCSRFVSKLYVHPNHPTWETVFKLKEHSSINLFLNEAKLCVNPDFDVPNDFKIAESAAKCLNESVINKLRQLRSSRDTLAALSFIPPCSATDDMFSSSCLEEDRKWTISTTGSPINLQPFAPPDHLDAKDKWWSEYGANLPDNRAQMKMTSRSTTQKRTIWVPPHHGTRTEYQPDTSHFLQRIWCRAVENDATFLVLNTGNSERIGIRHRATNTLFLTPPLDPFQPPYMRYHMALYASIIDDAFSRLDATEVSQRRNQKRPAPDDQIPTRTSKRLKGEEAQNDVIRPGEDNETEIASRHVLLVSFHFGPFHSPAPSSFLRVSSSCHPSFVSKSFSKPKANRQYPLTKCLNFVAKEKVGQGATGTVYRGSLEMETSSGRILDEDVVLKIPLGNKPIDRIHQEYAVYKQLAEAGVSTGIAKVYGVFEDVETGSIAMMMQYVGTNLLSRERQRMVTAHSTSLCRQITISQIEFDELFNIIKGINDAGILHNDLKPDNIVVDENGRLSIIDFDTTRPMYKPRDYKESPDIVTLRDIFAREFLKDKHYVRW